LTHTLPTIYVLTKLHPQAITSEVTQTDKTLNIERKGS